MPKVAAGLEARAGAAARDRTGLVDRTEFLRVALQVAAHQGEVLVDPDEDAAAEEMVAVATAHDDEGLLVLRTHGVEEFRAVVAAALPVGPDERDRAGVLVVVGEAHALGQEGGDGRRDRCGTRP